LLGVAFSVLALFVPNSASAATPTSYSVVLADPSANLAAANTYSLAFSNPSATVARCINVRFGGPDGTAPAPNKDGWQYQGGSETDGSTVTLTTALQKFSGTIAAFRASMPSEGFHVTFDGYMGGGGGADGMTFSLLNADAYGGFAGSSGGGLGYSGLSGIAVTMDTYQNPLDPSANFMGIATSGIASDITYAATNTSVPSLRTTHAYDIAYTGGHLIVKVDSVQVFDQVITVPTKIIPAFTSGTGAVPDIHRVSNIAMTWKGAGVAGTSTTMPVGMNVSTSSLSGSTAVTSGNWGNAVQNADTLSWTYAAGQSLGGGTLVINGITHNPTLADTYYARLTTYSDVGCNTVIDNASAAFVITKTLRISAEIEPALLFSVAGYNSGTCNGATVDVGASTALTVSLGNLTFSTKHVAGQTLSTSTNAKSGYTVYARYSGMLSDGFGHVIADWSGTNANPTAFPSAGTAAFAYTTDHALSASGAGTTRFQTDKWAAMTTTNAEVAYVATGYVSDSTHICYQAAASTTTPAGSYATTIIYTAVPSF
jgi:hypothetical protein